MTTVLVTGASGFVASWLIKKLIDSKKYHVRGTVRNLQDPYKTAHLRELFPTLELFEADLLKEGSFDKACEGCVYVFHTASPFQLVVENAQRDLVDPALNGTLNVLRSAEKAGTVQRVVLTSSVAAIAASKQPEEYVFTEEDWNLDSRVDYEPYRYSKTVAEKAAVDFVAGKKMELVRICPSFVLGPVLSKRVDATSVSSVIELLNGKYLESGCPPSCFGMVDVRDVADAHIAAAERKEAAGRYMVTSETGVSRLEYAQALSDSGKFPGYKFPTKLSAPIAKRPRYSHSKAEKELGIKFTPYSQSIVEMAESLIKLGLVQ